LLGSQKRLYVFPRLSLLTPPLSSYRCAIFLSSPPSVFFFSFGDIHLPVRLLVRQGRYCIFWTPARRSCDPPVFLFFFPSRCLLLQQRIDARNPPLIPYTSLRTLFFPSAALNYYWKKQQAFEIAESLVLILPPRFDLRFPRKDRRLRFITLSLTGRFLSPHLPAPEKFPP